MGRHFGVGVYMPKKEVNIGSLYRTAHLYGADFIFTVGKRYSRQTSDTTHAARNVPLFHFTGLDDLLDHLPDFSPLVGIELDPRAVPLTRYTHRPIATYLLGAEDHGLPEDVLNRCADVVQIPTVKPWSMNVACAGSIVLASRYAQEESNG